MLYRYNNECSGFEYLASILIPLKYAYIFLTGRRHGPPWGLHDIMVNVFNMLYAGFIVLCIALEFYLKNDHHDELDVMYYQIPLCDL